jgi:hypothetical protein
VAASADTEAQNPAGPAFLIDATLSARAIFAVSGHTRRFGTNVEIFDATLTVLPFGFLNTLTVQEFLQVPRTTLACPCAAPAVASFGARAPRRYCGEVNGHSPLRSPEIPPEGPLVLSLTKLSILNTLHTGDMHHLLDMLTGRVEQDVPLEVPDLPVRPVPIRV